MIIEKGLKYYDDFVSYFKSNTLIPVVGSGISVGVSRGEYRVPSGVEYKKHMVAEIMKARICTDDEIQRMKFSEIALLYENDRVTTDHERRMYYKKYFSGFAYKKSDLRKIFFDIGWPYIYSLNIDDVIENSTGYKTIILPNRDFNAAILKESKCLFKLHGDVNEIITYSDGVKIFTSKEYAKSIITNRPILNRLAMDIGNSNILYIGCSLDDEIDLMAIENIVTQVLPTTRDKVEGGFVKKNFIFMKTKPSQLEQIKLESFGITDILLFDSYEEIYNFLSKTWKESQKIDKEHYKKHATLKRVFLQSNDEKNREFFYKGYSLLDIKHETITYPYQMIKRTYGKKTLEYMDLYSVVILKGHRFSGKSYFLCDLYRTVIDRNTYYFDGRTKLTDEALKSLIKEEHTLSMFDTDALSREQVRIVLSNADIIKANRSCVFVFVNLFDNHISGLIQLMKDQGEFQKQHVYIEKEVLSNYFDYDENKTLNQKLPVVGLPICKKGDTILDYLLRTSDIMGVENMFSDLCIDVDSIQKLAFYIALCSKEVLYYSDIVELEFIQIIGEMIKKYSPLIEVVLTNSLERDNRNMSNEKYILNSKYWLRKELLQVAAMPNGDEMIKEAYHYLVERLIDFSLKDISKKRIKYRQYIYFDVINGIFSGRNDGNRQLVVKIYEGLNDLLSRDFQFNHQRAKCLAKNGYYELKNEIRIKQYVKAIEYAKIASSQAEREYSQSGNNKLCISMAHIDYTIARTSALLCIERDLVNEKEICSAIEACSAAVKNPYNSDDLERDFKNSQGIVYFVRMILDKGVMIGDKAIQKKYDELLSICIKWNK